MEEISNSVNERALFHRLIKNAWSERLPVTLIFFVIGYPFLWRLAVRTRLERASRKSPSPFIYTLR